MKEQERIRVETERIRVEWDRQEELQQMQKWKLQQEQIELDRLYCEGIV